MTHRVALRCTRAALTLRELTGSDERAVADVSAASAVALIDRLLDGAAVEAGDLAAADRDALLAAVHRSTFGDRIEATVDCAACGEAFDIAFELAALERSLVAAAPASLRRDADGVLEAPGIGRFRLPTGVDEVAVAGEDEESAAAALLERCLIEPDDAFDLGAFETLLEQLAPLVDRDLDAACPECGAERVVRFDVQSYLLGTVLAERERLLADVHRLATAYGWGHEEILGLPRAERHALVRLVEAEGTW